MKAIQVEEMAQQVQQADTQKDLQLNEQVAQITQLQQKIEVLQQQMRNRGNVIVFHLRHVLISHGKIYFPWNRSLPELFVFIKKIF